MQTLVLNQASFHTHTLYFYHTHTYIHTHTNVHTYIHPQSSKHTHIIALCLSFSLFFVQVFVFFVFFGKLDKRCNGASNEIVSLKCKQLFCSKAIKRLLPSILFLSKLLYMCISHIWTSILWYGMP